VHLSHVHTSIERYVTIWQYHSLRYKMNSKLLRHVEEIDGNLSSTFMACSSQETKYFANYYQSPPPNHYHTPSFLRKKLSKSPQILTEVERISIMGELTDQSNEDGKNTLLEWNNVLKSHSAIQKKSERDQLPTKNDRIFVDIHSGKALLGQEFYLHSNTRPSVENENSSETLRDSSLIRTNTNLPRNPIPGKNENSSRKKSLSTPINVDTLSEQFTYPNSTISKGNMNSLLIGDVRTSKNSMNNSSKKNSLEKPGVKQINCVENSLSSNNVRGELVPMGTPLQESTTTDKSCEQRHKTQQLGVEENHPENTFHTLNIAHSNTEVFKNYNNFAPTVLSSEAMNNPSRLNFGAAFSDQIQMAKIDLKENRNQIMEMSSVHGYNQTESHQNQEFNQQNEGQFHLQSNNALNQFNEENGWDRPQDASFSHRFSETTRPANYNMSYQFVSKQSRQQDVVGALRTQNNNRGHSPDVASMRSRQHSLNRQEHHRRTKSLEDGKPFHIPHDQEAYNMIIPQDYTRTNFQDPTYMETHRKASPLQAPSSLHSSNFFSQADHPHLNMYRQSGTRTRSHIDDQNLLPNSTLKKNTIMKQGMNRLPPRNQNINSTSHHNSYQNHNSNSNVQLQQQKQRRHHALQQPIQGSTNQPPIPSGLMSLPPQHSGTSAANQSNAHQQNRSAPDILKTLLRKKACLYETDTSRAIALITWLVGRRMALNLGYFSRQQLQSGVHFVVSPKISAGIITRTKVNRCMQIILNSCFHYIIPRPDGGEEKGDAFKKDFAETVQGLEDDNLVKALPVPWNDLNVGKALEDWLEIAEDHQEEDEGGEGLQKRTVLLCFNENVRSSDDVFRCHNEFIRDAANSASLILTAEEWRIFFAGGTDHDSLNRDIDSSASSQSAQSPQVQILPSKDGMSPAPDLSQPSNSTSISKSSIFSTVCKPATKGMESTTDEMLGHMSAFELGKFRTTWCSKRYEHDCSLCGFAHAEINRGWLRRDPTVHRYRDELCPKVYLVPPGNDMEGCLFNACPNGINCEFAHSLEEIQYHPNKYKRNICPDHSAGRKCALRDICPFSHPPTLVQDQLNGRHKGGYRATSTAGINSQDKNRFGQLSTAKQRFNSSTQNSTKAFPKVAPMMYVDGAPFSEFDKSLLLPGLKGLFRRRSETVWLHFCGKDKTNYENF